MGRNIIHFYVYTMNTTTGLSKKELLHICNQHYAELK